MLLKSLVAFVVLLVLWSGIGGWTTAMSCHGYRGAAKKIFAPWSHRDFWVWRLSHIAGWEGWNITTLCFSLMPWVIHNIISYHINIVTWEFLSILRISKAMAWFFDSRNIRHEANALDGALYKPFQWWVPKLSWWWSAGGEGSWVHPAKVVSDKNIWLWKTVFQFFSIIFFCNTNIFQSQAAVASRIRIPLVAYWIDSQQTLRSGSNGGTGWNG